MLSETWGFELELLFTGMSSDDTDLLDKFRQ